jgi:hypothetical protein
MTRFYEHASRPDSRCTVSQDDEQIGIASGRRIAAAERAEQAYLEHLRPLLQKLAGALSQAGDRTGAVEPKNAHATTAITFLDRPQGSPPRR